VDTDQDFSGDMIGDRGPDGGGDLRPDNCSESSELKLWHSESFRFSKSAFEESQIMGGSPKNSTEIFRRFEFGLRLFAPLLKRFGVRYFGLGLVLDELGLAGPGSDDCSRLFSELISTICFPRVSSFNEIVDFEKEITVGIRTRVASVSCSNFSDFDLSVGLETSTTFAASLSRRFDIRRPDFDASSSVSGMTFSAVKRFTLGVRRSFDFELGVCC